jgi:hypothetical protein
MNMPGLLVTNAFPSLFQARSTTAFLVWRVLCANSIGTLVNERSC